MPELPVLTARETVRAFQLAGFILDRSKGSHHILKKPGHPYVVSVPIHRGEDLPRGTLRSLIRLAGLSVKEFIDLLNE